MNVSKRMAGIFGCLGMLILILDGQTALEGASIGLDLCLKTVIPSLFPFLFLISLMTNALWGGQAPWLRSIGKKLGIPEGAESILLCGVLGGYPAGAQTIGRTYENGTLKKEDAEHLLSFCNNPGPAFLFGMTAASFPEHGAVWAMWAIQLLSAAMTARSFRYTPRGSAALPDRNPTLSELLMQTIRTMAAICGWILLFRMLTLFLEKWVMFLFPTSIRVLITGLLELSNGCCMLSSIEDFSLRFLICATLLSFGGLCVTMQTISVIENLSAHSYFKGKLRQTAFCLSLSLLYLWAGWMILAISGIFLWIFPGSSKKRGGFPAVQGV